MQVRREYLGDICVHVWEEGNSLHLGDEDSDEAREDWTPPPEGDDPRDNVLLFLVRLISLS